MSVSLDLFSAWCLKKKFLLYSITWTSFIVWLPLLHEILGNMCIVIACLQECDVINTETDPIFLMKPFILHNQNVKTKTWISWQRKELLRWNKIYFSSILKGFHWSKYNHFFERWKSDFKIYLDNHSAKYYKYYYRIYYIKKSKKYELNNLCHLTQLLEFTKICENQV